MNGSTDKTHSLAQYIAACIGIVFFGVAFLVLGAILPILTQEYNLDNVMSSTLAGILPSAILAGSLLFGPIIDRYGYKLLMIVASILGAAGLLIIATAGNISIVMAGIACMGLSGGFLNGATNALASDVSTDRNRDRNLMLLGLFYCGGAILTTYLIPAFAETYPYRKILSAAAAIMFASCLYYIFIRFPKGKCAEGIPVKKVIALLKHPVLLILSISLFFQSALEGITGNRVSQYLIEMESFSLKDAGIALSFVMIGLGIGRLVNSFILKYVSKPFIITSGMIIAMCGITILMNAQSLHQWIDGSLSAVFIATAGTILLGFGITVTIPIVLSCIGELFKDLSGTAFSIAMVTSLLGNSILNFLMGKLGIAAFPYVLWGCAICVIILFNTGYRLLSAKNKK